MSSLRDLRADERTGFQFCKISSPFLEQISTELGIPLNYIKVVQLKSTELLLQLWCKMNERTKFCVHKSTFWIFKVMLE